MRNALRAGIGGVVLVLIILSAWALLQSYLHDGFSYAFASTSATIGLVMLTGWYAYSTSKLLNLNERQIEAAQATYMPALDIDYQHKSNGDIRLLIRNRGQGVARNVEILLSIVGGEASTYKAKLSESIPPHYQYSDGKVPGIEISPRFYLEFDQKTVRDAFDDPEEVELIGDVLEYGSTTEMGDEPITNLQDLFDGMNEDYDMDVQLPNSQGDFSDLIDKFTENKPSTYSPAIYLQIVFTDVIYGEIHAETVFDGGYVDPDNPKIDELQPGSHQIRRSFGGKPVPFREVHGDVVESELPYIDDVDVDVISTDPA